MWNSYSSVVSLSHGGWTTKERFQCGFLKAYEYFKLNLTIADQLFNNFKNIKRELNLNVDEFGNKPAWLFLSWMELFNFIIGILLVLGFAISLLKDLIQRILPVQQTDGQERQRRNLERTKFGGKSTKPFLWQSGSNWDSLCKY